MQYNNLTFLLSFFNLDPAGSPDSPDGAMDTKSITALLSQGAGKTPGICFDRKKLLKVAWKCSKCTGLLPAKFYFIFPLSLFL